MELDVGHAVHLPAGGGDIVRDVPESRLEILSDRDELHATWTRFGPHRDGASPHVHRQHSDLFYVLEGELTVLVGPDRTETRAPAGTLALAPPLVVHGFRNASDGEMRYLNFHAPGRRVRARTSAVSSPGSTRSTRPRTAAGLQATPISARARCSPTDPACASRSSSTWTRSGSWT